MEGTMGTRIKAPFTPLHGEVVHRVRQLMPEDEDLGWLAAFFKVFGDPTRLKILYALFSEEMCVYDMGALLQMEQSAVSHQLKILKDAGLVRKRRQGKLIYYSLTDEHIKQICDQSLEHILER
jgi:ArsR family transcriptional regulator